MKLLYDPNGKVALVGDDGATIDLTRVILSAAFHCDNDVRTVQRGVGRTGFARGRPTYEIELRLIVDEVGDYGVAERTIAPPPSCWRCGDTGRVRVTNTGEIKRCPEHSRRSVAKPDEPLDVELLDETARLIAEDK